MHKPLSTLGILIGCVACFLGQARSADTVQVVPERAFHGAQQPQLAVSPSGKVYLVFGAGSAVYCTVSGDGGKSGLGSLVEKFRPEINELEGIAIGAIGALVRDLIKQSAAEPLADQLEDVANRVTEKLGGHVMKEPLLAHSPHG